ncbi:MAG: MBL fold metallo-hydrolase [Deltaproteobacteria bacterium]|nr:MBL fold metallo-hydrolase [Deltaproteobacteria bacterium]
MIKDCPKDSTELNGIKYEWLGQSTMRITARGVTIYTDPVMLDENPPKADLIFITHHHVDHCLPEFVERLREERTKLVAFHPAYVQHCAHDIKGVRTVNIGQTIELSGQTAGPAGVRITGVEAYTKRGFHSRGEGCGFLIEMAGQRIWFSGDTARTPEMEGLKDIDAAIVSICDNIGAINPMDIVEAVKEIKPRLFIPVHYTPPGALDPVVKEGLIATKDPRFFTKKTDPLKLAPHFEGTGIDYAVLKMLSSYTP